MTLDESHSADQPFPPSDGLSVSSPLSALERAKNFQLSLDESEGKYQRLVEGISGDYIIYTHDPPGRITYVSPSVEKVLGYPVEKVIGLNWRDLIHEHFVGRDLADRVFYEIAEGKKFYAFKAEISHANGSKRLIEIQQRPVFDSNGQYVSMEGIAKDITETTRNAEELERLKQGLENLVIERTAELVEANEKLRKSEGRYRSVVERQTEFVVRWLPNATFTFVNDAFCRLVDRTKEELIDWCFLPMIYPEDSPKFEASVAGMNRENPIATVENRMVLFDGSVRWGRWTNQMLFDESGEFIEYQSVGHDITELKNAADTIREKEGHLAHVSRLATVGELVAGMAHEIHQPLHAAKVFAEAARRNLEIVITDENQSNSNIESAIDCANEISEAITRAAKIIRGLRDYTRPRATKFEPLDINDVVRSACGLIAFEANKAHAELVFELAKGLPNVQGDQVQLEQICVNLLMNAFEAMAGIPAKKRRVFIGTRYESQVVQLKFCDSGNGVADENMGKLFEAFYSTKEQGMGMGLSLCKSLAESHGGSIRGVQNEGQGMTFVLELPVQHTSLTKKFVEEQKRKKDIQ